MNRNPPLGCGLCKYPTHDSYKHLMTNDMAASHESDDTVLVRPYASFQSAQIEQSSFWNFLLLLDY